MFSLSNPADVYPIFGLLTLFLTFFLVTLAHREVTEDLGIESELDWVRRQVSKTQFRPPHQE